VILLDTHVLLWYLLGSRLLPAEVRTRIKDEALVFVSTASIWEIGVKARLGKLRIDGKPIHSKEKVEQIVRACEEEEFQFLAVNLQASVEAPFLNGNHRDPFDRILGAQSLSPNRLTIVSGDAVFDEMSKDIRRYWTGTANPSKPQ
jgi:PIN domain nuclease of toxin-antitoxin system